MIRLMRWLVAPAIFVALLTTAGAVSAATIEDEAGFFSAEAIDKAKTQIAAMEKKHKHELAVETFSAIPAERKKDYTPEKKAKFFEEWAIERAKNLKVNGVYILVCQDPSYLEVLVGNNTQKAGFSPAERRELRDKLVEQFKAKEYDKGLLEAVAYVDERYQVHFTKQESSTAVPTSGGEAGKPAEGGFMGSLLGFVCIGVVVLLGVWLIIGVIRGLSGGGGGYGYGGGGGGFLPSLMGGMFGAVAGMWMYDHFMGGGSHATAGPSSYGADPGDAGASTAADTDYSGSGGDLDDAGEWGGGGDFGGGGAGADDFGGGDFGGGDFGGGDFSGGGDF